MKRVSLFIFILFLILLTGCGAAEELKAEGESEHVTISGGSVGGVWSIFNEGIAEAIRKENPDIMVNPVPGTVAGNAVLVEQGKAEFAISESLTAMFAYEGHAPFETKHENIRAVAAVIPINVYQLVAPKNVPFDSVEEIVNNKVPLHFSVGEKGALGDIVSSSIFEAYDMTYENIEQNDGMVHFLSGGKTFEMMADGRMDGLGKMVPIPAGDIIEASTTIDMKLVPIGQQAIDHLVEKYGMTPFTIEANSYDFQTEDYPTINTPTILITSEEVSEELVYNVTKAIYEQLDYLYDVHNGFKEVNDETIVEIGNIPMHEGAKKFYQEAGLMN